MSARSRERWKLEPLQHPIGSRHCLLRNRCDMHWSHWMVRYMSVGAHIIQQGATEGNVAPTPANIHMCTHSLSGRHIHPPRGRTQTQARTCCLCLFLTRTAMLCLCTATHVESLGLGHLRVGHAEKQTTSLSCPSHNSAGTPHSTAYDPRVAASCRTVETRDPYLVFLRIRSAKPPNETRA